MQAPEEEAQRGGLIVKVDKDRHLFKAPAPRTSLLGKAGKSGGSGTGHHRRRVVALSSLAVPGMRCIRMLASGLHSRFS